MKGAKGTPGTGAADQGKAHQDRFCPWWLALFGAGWGVFDGGAGSGEGPAVTVRAGADICTPLVLAFSRPTVRGKTESAAIGRRSADGWPGSRCARYWWRVDGQSVVDCGPARGKKNGHETKLSFQVVVFAAAQQTLTAFECRRDTVGAKSEKTPVIRRGESKTVSLARRPRLVPKGRARKGHELLRVFSR